jgi:uncharacterized protein
MPAGRDREPGGRARNERERDGLGRPLPRGVAGVPRQPEGVVRTPDDALLEAQRLLDQGMPFHAHEVLEDAWKAAPEGERPLWKGLTQLAVGVTRTARGNAVGAAALLTRGADNLESYRDDPPHGIDITSLLRWARHHAATMAAIAVATEADGAGRIPVLRLRGGSSTR